MSMTTQPNNQPLKLNSRFILFIVMFYLTVSLAADVIAFKFANFFGFVESGATIIFPLTYVIGDVTCEVYGWNIAMRMVWFMLICEAIFALLITIIIHVPSYPHFGQYQNEYNDILDNLWIFVASGILGNAICSLLNVFFISKWKILAHGKAFWFRSILSTCISEFVLVLIVIGLSFAPMLNNAHNSVKIFFDAYFLEILYAIIFVIPAQYLVNVLKRLEGIDAYDYGVSYNPFKFIS